jgi:chromosome segregation ATPase
LSHDLEAMNARVAELGVQLRALEQLPSLMASLQDQADGLASTQRSADHKLGRAAEDAARVQQQVEELGESVQVAATLKRDITRYEELIPETKTQLEDLERLASGVTDQVSALDEQRAAIDRAVEEAKSLDAVLVRIEEVARRQKEQADRFADLEASAESLEALDREVLGRAEEIRSRQVQLDAQDQTTLEELAAMRSSLSRSLERVEFSNREFESLNQRVERLRDGLAEMETQIGVLEASGEAISEVQSLAVDLSQRMRSIADDCARLPDMDAGLQEVRSVHSEVQERSEQLTIHQEEIDGQIAAQQKEIEWQIATQQQEIDEQITTQQRKLSEQMDQQQREFEVRLAAQKQEIGAQIATQQRELDEKTTAVHDDLSEMREGIGKAVERVNTATRAYGAVSEQTAALRRDLEDLEGRFDVLRESGHSIAGVERDAQDVRGQLSTMTEDLHTRLSTVAEECNRLDEAAERIRAIRGDSDKLDEAVYGIEQRVVKIESVRTDVDAAARDLADLTRKSEAITDAMKQTREARNEISQMRDEHVETRKWLTELEGGVSTLHTAVEDLHGMKPMVEFVREEAERVNAAMETMESRRGFIQELDRRLVELESLGARLGDGIDRTPSQPGVKRSWRLAPSLSVDGSTWEFGLQLRFAGRWKRGVALWLGPVRLFLGWALRDSDASDPTAQEGLGV